MSDQFRIQNCPTRFQFQCPQLWAKLTPTSDQSIRHCEACDENVYLCHSGAKANDHARLGHCIALDLKRESDVPMMTLGRLLPTAEPDWAAEDRQNQDSSKSLGAKRKRDQKKNGR